MARGKGHRSQTRLKAVRAGHGARWQQACRPILLPSLRLAVMVGLAGCGSIFGSDLAPSDGPRPVSPPAHSTPPAATERDEVLIAYYRRQQDDLQVRGLLRVDGGGPDTDFDAEDLARNFEAVAFSDEHFMRAAAGGAQVLRRWDGPVRIGISFGATVPMGGLRRNDTATLGHYASRLARITGHDIRYVPSGANFHVMVIDEADRPEAIAQIQRIAPDLSARAQAQLLDLPIGVHCLVLGFAAQGSAVYQSAVVLIRAEHPPLMRRACIHEEVAQGLGLRNDSAEARPSIFNDDMEFALLTSQDEMMLKMLYDPRLAPGMTLETARPLIRALSQDLQPTGPS
ncbi:DUF2927 domain-containing protein [Pseudooceanicola algae]|uniref:DUF2927 domain-containing protein n=1 Tax=Pseudooceanicola algae TaxID=1537215 RepID=A0A418SHF6_9RHOB|nr:DUF2927 domain-containing protein [Pseudooceanicola algae]QPM90393.1 hypothetical protein PSAL_016310 [Pseudooceanicola algae]